MTTRILIIGGTGVFGKRLVRHLAARGGIALYVSSRRLSKARDFITSLKDAAASLHPVELDCANNLQEVLGDVQPDIVVDCSGPFQVADYETARLILQAGAHLIDLADARDYLAGFTNALDQTARKHKVAALSGASSTPTLSTAVATHITEGWQRVDTIDICITPGGKSEVGRSVIEAILSYAGKGVPVWKDGRLSQTTGWQGGRRADMPGLGSRRVAAVETFDAEHLGPRLNVQSRVSFAAGLESRIEQYGIELLAGLRKHGLIGPPDILIPWLLKARRITRIPTSTSGGMLVEVSGINANGAATRTKWSLVARQDHGPYIPILPAAAAVEKLLSKAVSSGAVIAHEAVALPDILHEMRRYEIQTETSSSQIEYSPFEQALGAETFAKLPDAQRRFHASTGPVLWSGKADIDAGRWFAPKALALIFGFPKAGRGVPVSVAIDRTVADGQTPAETWTRCFAGKMMSSDLQHLKGATITEAFAPFTFELPLSADAQGVVMPVSGWRLGPIRLPAFLAPRSETWEFMDDEGRFRFDVRLSAPFIGLLAHYRGWLAPGPFLD